MESKTVSVSKTYLPVPLVTKTGTSVSLANATLPFGVDIDLPTGVLVTVGTTRMFDLSGMLPATSGTSYASCEVEVPGAGLSESVTLSKLRENPILKMARLAPAVTQALDDWFDEVLSKIPRGKRPRTLQSPSAPLWMQYPALLPTLMDSPVFSEIGGIRLPVRLQKKNSTPTELVIIFRPDVIRSARCPAHPSLKVLVPKSFRAITTTRTAAA